MPHSPGASLILVSHLSSHLQEKELHRLEDIIDHLKSRWRKEKRLKATLKEDVTVLENLREALRRELEELGNSAKKRKYVTL